MRQRRPLSFLQLQAPQIFYIKSFNRFIVRVLKATAGAVATALVNLASDVTGILPIGNGGTGTSTSPVYGQILVGNASGTFTYMTHINARAWRNKRHSELGRRFWRFNDRSHYFWRTDYHLRYYHSRWCTHYRKRRHRLGKHPDRSYSLWTGY